MYSYKAFFNHSMFDLTWLSLLSYVFGSSVLLCFLDDSCLPSDSHFVSAAWVVDPENNGHFHLKVCLSVIHGWVGWNFYQPASQTETLAFLNFKSC